jgi:hypothetical protein
MEHSLPALELSRPWRRAALLAGTFAAAELVLILVLAGALLGRPVADRIEQHAAPPAAPTPATAPKPPPKKQEPVPALPRAETSVIVLNGNGRSGAAGEVGARIKAQGYVLASVANAPRSDYGKTFVMYRPGMQAEAERLARDLKVGVVAPLDGIRPGELMGAHVVVILGR